MKYGKNLTMKLETRITKEQMEFMRTFMNGYHMIRELITRTMMEHQRRKNQS